VHLFKFTGQAFVYKVDRVLHPKDAYTSLERALNGLSLTQCSGG
jgi:hypothetical protein